MSQNIEGQNEFVNVSANGANSARLSSQNNSGNIASASASVSANQNSASMGPSAMTNLPPSANLNSNSGSSAISPGLDSLAQNLNMDTSAAYNSQNIESSAAPSMNMGNSGSIVPEVPPVPEAPVAPSTQPTLTFAPIVPPSAPLPASLPSAPEAVPTLTAAEAAAAAKAARSKKQSEADAGQAAMLAKLRNMYAAEFANIPEKKRPKAKAYVARAAYYKEGAERNAYIKEWLRKDREAAEVRMGQRKKAAATPRSFLNSSLRSNSLAMSSAASNTRNITKKLKFYPSADPLRAQVIKARKHLDEIADHATKRLSEAATDSKTRRVARQLRTQMRKYTTILAKEVRHQASALERAAKARARAAYRTYRNAGSSASISGSATTNRTRKTSSGNIINSYND